MFETVHWMAPFLCALWIPPTLLYKSPNTQRSWHSTLDSIFNSIIDQRLIRPSTHFKLKSWWVVVVCWYWPKLQLAAVYIYRQQYMARAKLLLFFLLLKLGVPQAILLIMATPSCEFKVSCSQIPRCAFPRDSNPRPSGWESDILTFRPRRSKIR
jgi:hypothetical protein